jgi:hypothetical protein
MATQTTLKIILPTPTEFIRYMAEVILLNQKNDNDTSTQVTPLVTRAKALTEKRGLLIVSLTKEI